MNISDVAADPTILDDVVNRTVANDDQMYSGHEDRYFGVGRDAIRKICAIQQLSDHTMPGSILDFACGHGRVLRYLRAAFPDVEIVASDVMKSAVKYASETFGATPHHSSPKLDDVNIGSTFALAWSGSLMTHLDEAQAHRLLALFERHLEPNGLAIFTVHGRFVADKYKSGTWPYRLSRERLVELSELFHAGKYAYSDYDHMKGYGISMTPLGWIMDALQKLPSMRLLTVMERGWDDHQDVVALQKRAV